MKDYDFDYSSEFTRLVVDLHKGKEASPYYEGYIEAHLGGPKSRITDFLIYTFITKWTGIPITTFKSSINHLVIQKFG